MANKLKDTLIIRGGKPLQGTIEVRGAKNAISKEMVAALLTDDKCILRNLSEVEDVDLVSEMIEIIGGKVDRKDGEVQINASGISEASFETLSKFARKSRIPILFCGPLLHRLKKAVIPSLGGCSIGKRPVNFHLEALKKMGAKVDEQPDKVIVTAEKLHGAKIVLDYPSVGATEQVLLSAVLADGVTQLFNAAVEPEIMDLIVLLQKMGAIISVDTDREITITGVEELHGYDHTAIPDRLEVASWACAAIATNGRIFIKNAQQIDLITFLNKIRLIGGGFLVKDDGIEFFRENKTLNPIAIETDVHPGFMTDWQQPFVITLTQAHGVSIIHETVYENRFGYVDALNKMGANIQLYRECLGGNKHCRFGQLDHYHSAVIAGATPLHGAKVKIPDLRAGFSYVIAALVANDVTTLENVSLLNRGYENLMEKLKSVGADIIEGVSPINSSTTPNAETAPTTSDASPLVAARA